MTQEDDHRFTIDPNAIGNNGIVWPRSDVAVRTTALRGDRKSDLLAACDLQRRLVEQDGGSDHWCRCSWTDVDLPGKIAQAIESSLPEGASPLVQFIDDPQREDKSQRTSNEALAQLVWSVAVGALDALTLIHREGTHHGELAEDAARDRIVVRRREDGFFDVWLQFPSAKYASRLGDIRHSVPIGADAAASRAVSLANKAERDLHRLAQLLIAILTDKELDATITRTVEPAILKSVFGRDRAVWEEFFRTAAEQQMAPEPELLSRLAQRLRQAKPRPSALAQLAAGIDRFRTSVSDWTSDQLLWIRDAAAHAKWAIVAVMSVIILAAVGVGVWLKTRPEFTITAIAGAHEGEIVTFELRRLGESIPAEELPSELEATLDGGERLKLTAKEEDGARTLVGTYAAASALPNRDRDFALTISINGEAHRISIKAPNDAPTLTLTNGTPTEQNKTSNVIQAAADGTAVATISATDEDTTLVGPTPLTLQVLEAEKPLKPQPQATWVLDPTTQRWEATINLPAGDSDRTFTVKDSASTASVAVVVKPAKPLFIVDGAKVVEQGADGKPIAPSVTANIRRNDGAGDATPAAASVRFQAGEADPTTRVATIQQNGADGTQQRPWTVTCDIPLRLNGIVTATLLIDGQEYALGDITAPDDPPTLTLTNGTPTEQNKTSNVIQAAADGTAVATISATDEDTTLVGPTPLTLQVLEAGKPLVLKPGDIIWDSPNDRAPAIRVATINLPAAADADRTFTVKDSASTASVAVVIKPAKPLFIVDGAKVVEQGADGKPIAPSVTANIRRNDGAGDATPAAASVRFQAGEADPTTRVATIQQNGADGTQQRPWTVICDIPLRLNGIVTAKLLIDGQEYALGDITAPDDPPTLTLTNGTAAEQGRTPTDIQAADRAAVATISATDEDTTLVGPTPLTLQVLEAGKPLVLKPGDIIWDSPNDRAPAIRVATINLPAAADADRTFTVKDSASTASVAVVVKPAKPLFIVDGAKVVEQGADGKPIAPYVTANIRRNDGAGDATPAAASVRFQAGEADPTTRVATIQQNNADGTQQRPWTVTCDIPLRLKGKVPATLLIGGQEYALGDITAPDDTPTLTLTNGTPTEQNKTSNVIQAAADGTAVATISATDEDTTLVGPTPLTLQVLEAEKPLKPQPQATWVLDPTTQRWETTINLPAGDSDRTFTVKDSASTASVAVVVKPAKPLFIVDGAKVVEQGADGKPIAPSVTANIRRNDGAGDATPAAASVRFQAGEADPTTRVATIQQNGADGTQPRPWTVICDIPLRLNGIVTAKLLIDGQEYALGDITAPDDPPTLTLTNGTAAEQGRTPTDIQAADRAAVATISATDEDTTLVGPTPLTLQVLEAEKPLKPQPQATWVLDPTTQRWEATISLPAGDSDRTFTVKDSATAAAVTVVVKPATPLATEPPLYLGIKFFPIASGGWISEPIAVVGGTVTPSGQLREAVANASLKTLTTLPGWAGARIPTADEILQLWSTTKLGVPGIGLRAPPALLEEIFLSIVPKGNREPGPQGSSDPDGLSKKFVCLVFQLPGAAPTGDALRVLTGLRLDAKGAKWVGLKASFAQSGIGLPLQLIGTPHTTQAKVPTQEAILGSLIFCNEIYEWRKRPSPLPVPTWNPEARSVGEETGFLRIFLPTLP